MNRTLKAAITLAGLLLLVRPASAGGNSPHFEQQDVFVRFSGEGA